MPRIRTIKPGFFTNELLGEIPPLGRLLFEGMWTIADRCGRLPDRPQRIRAAVLPYDVCDAEPLLQALAERNFIIRYSVDSTAYIQIVNWDKHQRPYPHEKPSVIPPPPAGPANPHSADVSAPEILSVGERIVEEYDLAEESDGEGNEEIESAGDEESGHLDQPTREHGAYKDQPWREHGAYKDQPWREHGAYKDRPGYLDPGTPGSPQEFLRNEETLEGAGSLRSGPPFEPDNPENHSGQNPPTAKKRGRSPPPSELHRYVTTIAAALGYDGYTNKDVAYRHAKTAVGQKISCEELEACARWMVDPKNDKRGFWQRGTVQIATVVSQLPAYRKAVAEKGGSRGGDREGSGGNSGESEYGDAEFE